MKFDIVIGNPPYNNNIYIEFCELAHRIAKICSSLIVPAKELNGKHFNSIEQMIYYPNVTDIFDIQLMQGVVYYIDKSNQQFQEKKIRVISKYNKLDSVNTETRNNYHISLHRNAVCSILSRIQDYFSIKYRLNDKRNNYLASGITGRKEKDSIEVVQGDNVVGYVNENEIYTQEGVDKYKACIHVRQVDGGRYDSQGMVFGTNKVFMLKPYQIPKGTYQVLACFDTFEELQSFKSYCETRLVAFLYFLAIKSDGNTIDQWKYVPDQEKFDHIFTDEELYSKYNITNEEKEIIESVIKSRVGKE